MPTKKDTYKDAVFNPKDNSVSFVDEDKVEPVDVPADDTMEPVPAKSKSKTNK